MSKRFYCCYLSCNLSNTRILLLLLWAAKLPMGYRYRSSSPSITSFRMIYTCIISRNSSFTMIYTRRWSLLILVDLLMICTISPILSIWRKCHFYYILYYKLLFYQKPLVYKFAQNRHLWINLIVFLNFTSEKLILQL